MAESLFAAGNQVGEVAKQVFGSDDGVEIPYSRGLNEALGQTAELVTNGHDAPIYEATFQYDSVLVRADVLLPLEDGGWRAIEVKAAASVKPTMNWTAPSSTGCSGTPAWTSRQYPWPTWILRLCTKAAVITAACWLKKT